MRYLGGYLTRSRLFSCSLDHAKRSFYRAANSIFSTIASDEIVLQLVKTKCIPVLLYGLEACELTNAQIDFVISRCFMKPFSTNNIEIVKSCQEFFRFDLPSVQLSKRVEKFVTGFYNGIDQYVLVF